MNITQIQSSDSLVSSIKIDVVSTDNSSQIKVNGVPTSPSSDFILMPSGLGFKQSLDVVTGDTIDYVVKQTIEKREIKLTIMWKGQTAYAKFQEFSTWIARYFDLEKYHIRFSYSINGTRRFVEVAATLLDLKGRNGSFVSAELTLKPLTPFYEETMVSFIVADANSGSIYPYVYPYVYGGGAYSGNNQIVNNYLESLPLRIVLKGPMDTPYVSIQKINEDGTVESDPYSRVQFADGVSIAANETITIDAFNKKIYLTSTNETTGAVTVTDLFNSVSKSYDAFLFAKPGSSKVSASLSDSKAECEIFFVRYVL